MIGRFLGFLGIYLFMAWKNYVISFDFNVHDMNWSLVIWESRQKYLFINSSSSFSTISACIWNTFKVAVQQFIIKSYNASYDNSYYSFRSNISNKNCILLSNFPSPNKMRPLNNSCAYIFPDWSVSQMRKESKSPSNISEYVKQSILKS